MPERHTQPVDPGSSALSDAVARFNRSWADFQGAALRFEREQEKQSRQLAEEREKKARREQASAATRAANQMAQQLLELNATVKDLASPISVAERMPDQLVEVPPLGVAQVVRVGRLRDGDVEALVREADVPALVGLLDQGNVVIEGEWGPEASGLLTEIVLRALAGTGAGQLALISIDPSLRTPLAFLDGLRVQDEGLFPPAASDKTAVSAVLEGLRDEVKALRGQIAGTAETLGAFRRQVQQPVGMYRCVVVTDYPNGFDDASRALLVDLMREGPSVGMSFVIQTDSGVYVDERGLDRTAFLEVTVDGIEHSAFPGRTVQPALMEPRRRSAVTAQILERVKESTAPSLAFAEVQPRADGPWDSSAEGITARVGISGASPLEFTLGNRSSQMHNILVSGAVGQGKSNLLMVMVHSLALRYSPDELQMYLLDFKDGVTLFPLAGGAQGDSWLPNAALLGLASDRAFGAAVLRDLTAEFEKRALVMRPFGDSVEAYRKAQPSEKMPRILVVIDEFQVLFEEDDAVADQALANLERLARKGRAYGIHLCLASQTLSGITKLLAKQDGIFSQFPIRVALKNSESESRAVLDPNNAAAARLRPREVVLNTDFGAAPGNIRGVVAYADPDELRSLRADLARNAGEAHRPHVFNGEVPASLVEHIDFMRLLRSRAVANPRSGRLALIGLPMGLAAEPRGALLLAEPGNNVALIGSAGNEQVSVLAESSGSDNLPIGVLQAMLTSLAVQSSDGGAHFVFLDFLSDQDSTHVDQARRMLELLGCGVEHLRSDAANQWLVDVDEHLSSGIVADSSSTYVVGWGLDRMRVPTNVLESPGDPVDGLALLATTGPQRGVHLIGWWSTYRGYSSQVINRIPSFDGAFQYVVALRVSRSDVQNMFGPLESWKPENNRGLLRDSLSEDRSGTVVPFRPLTLGDVNRLSREVWDSGG